MSCICTALLSFIYCFFPLSYCPIVSTCTADAPVIDYFLDDRTSTVELTGKQSHSLPQISPIFPYFSCTRHCYCCCYVAYLFNCIACHCRPLMYLSISYATYKYVYYIQK